MTVQATLAPAAFNAPTTAKNLAKTVIKREQINQV
jgi:hypothetical protein